MHWAVATPVAEGVGRLPSRSKRGRYRPEVGFLLAPFLRSVAGHLLFSWSLPVASSGLLATNTKEKALRSAFPPRSIPLRRLKPATRQCHLLEYMEIPPQVPEVWVDCAPEI
jgi:hypothetical protein